MSTIEDLVYASGHRGVVALKDGDNFELTDGYKKFRRTPAGKWEVQRYNSGIYEYFIVSPALALALENIFSEFDQSKIKAKP